MFTIGKELTKMLFDVFGVERRRKQHKALRDDMKIKFRVDFGLKGYTSPVA